MLNLEIYKQYLVESGLDAWAKKTGLYLSDSEIQALYANFEGEQIDYSRYKSQFAEPEPEVSFVIRAASILNKSPGKWWTGILNALMVLAETRQIDYRITGKLFLWSDMENKYYLDSDSGDIEEFPKIEETKDVKIIEENGLVKVVEKKGGRMTSLLLIAGVIAGAFYLSKRKKPTRKKRR